ncbi:uncharacterized protein SAPINGB_P001681 [Magnusiomyces paraingens]|uniref:Succinate dehydrogenase assembly factor 2, mitochondrial n=1 Tax=Magnusiomyces paraingens TaxID=2606893 RepID=A0A5E8B754_9ASCO|nr:uncharacterized protein SAPINGB_P001681 [Saprochaete ingens]VVT47378.1 unnamed protein product [Saprochaete ingens]
MSLLRTSFARQLRTANSARLFTTAATPLLQSAKPPTSKIELKIEPLPRPGEKIETKRARLLYQSRKRGILETDLLLSKFAQLYLAEMTMEELEEYDKLLDEQDWDIYYWITKNDDIKPCPERWNNSPLMKKIREMVETKGNECTRMPDLY